MSFLAQPWPWYIAGPIIGLMVPLLLISGNKYFGISSSLRHICAACIPGNVNFFKYDWKSEKWNLLFVFGVVLGGFIGGYLLPNPDPVALNEKTKAYFSSKGISDLSGLAPQEIFSPASLLSAKGIIMMILGGFMVGFGTRYANGCTSGHSIMGISNLQLSSLIATVCFFIGGLIMTWLILPYILAL